MDEGLHRGEQLDVGKISNNELEKNRLQSLVLEISPRYFPFNMQYHVVG